MTMTKSQVLKFVAIGLAVLTLFLTILCFSNIFSDGKKYAEEQLEKSHQALLENLEFQDELKDYGSRYSAELDLTQASEEVHRDNMWRCQQKINEYNQKATVFGILAVVSGLATVVVIILIKRKA